jgi:imidazole glycerol phosphate synthase glutamine amidotransferase subunit
MRAAVCDYGAGNVRSVIAALRRLGAEADSTRDPADVLAADLAVLPGVGSAASAMAGLRAAGLDDALRERVGAGGPTLGICLGLQLALEESEEDGGVPGLGLLPGRAERLREGRVPRIGWAPVEPWGGDFYFAHSYAADTSAAVARSEGIVAAAESGSFLGVQFHPEKSGAAGARFLAQQLEQCLSRV